MPYQLLTVHTLRRFAQTHAQAGAWLLVLAILLSAAWGQAHRVLHSGGLAPLAIAAKANADQQVAVAVLADEEGSSLCKLLDQLALGAGAASAPPTAAPSLPATLQAGVPALPHWLVATRRFDARGPPAVA